MGTLKTLDRTRVKPQLLLTTPLIYPLPQHSSAVSVVSCRLFELAATRQTQRSTTPFSEEFCRYGTRVWNQRSEPHPAINISSQSTSAILHPSPVRFRIHLNDPSHPAIPNNQSNGSRDFPCDLVLLQLLPVLRFVTTPTCPLSSIPANEFSDILI